MTMKNKYKNIFLGAFFGLFLPISALAVIGPEPSPGYTDYTAPALPSNVSLTSDGVKVIITWTDPDDTDLYRYEVMRNAGGTTLVTGNTYAYVEKAVQKFTDENVVAGDTYKYVLRVFDYSLNNRLTDEYSVKVVAPAAETPQVEETPPAAAPTPETTPEPTVTPSPAPTIADPTDIAVLTSFLRAERDTDAETKAAANAASDQAEFKVVATENQTKAMTNFIAYGISLSTQKLGTGERRAVLRDYLEIIGKAGVVWSDIENIANGLKPVGRNLNKEKSQVGIIREMWKKMLGRDPNFKDAKEDLAWNTMMYRVRFDRDLEKEKDGIGKFRGIFKRLPISPLDWAAVRALGYVL